jgi:hypothetical protein
MEEKVFWVKMLKNMNADVLKLSQIGLAELMDEYFNIVGEYLEILK